MKKVMLSILVATMVALAIYGVVCFFEVKNIPMAVLVYLLISAGFGAYEYAPSEQSKRDDKYAISFAVAGCSAFSALSTIETLFVGFAAIIGFFAVVLMIGKAFKMKTRFWQVIGCYLLQVAVVFLTIYSHLHWWGDVRWLAL